MMTGFHSIPLPFAREHLRTDDRPLAGDGLREVQGLLVSARRVLNATTRRLGREPERGQVWRDLEAMAQWIGRAQEVLITQYQRERGERQPGEEAGHV